MCCCAAVYAFDRLPLLVAAVIFFYFVTCCVVSYIRAGRYTNNVQVLPHYGRAAAAVVRTNDIIGNNGAFK